MTGKDILKADIIDIIFENRNKEYGAYSLRRNYNNRLSIALSCALAVVLLLFLISFNGNKNEPVKNDFNEGSVIVVEMPPEKPKEPEPIEEKPKPAQAVAQVKYTSKIKIVENEETDLPAITNVAEKVVSSMNVAGELPQDPNEKVIMSEKDNGGEKANEPEIKKDFKPEERGAEFPGGRTALSQFFSRNLRTPDDIEPGEKKIILVRFVVDVDGSVSKIELLQSGGDKYDKEIIRVFRKMPRWFPAIQNGHKVPVNLIQPVTFVGVED